MQKIERVHARVDEDGHDRGDSWRDGSGNSSVGGGGEYHDDGDDGSDGGDGGDRDSHDNGPYHGIIDTASSVHGYHGSDTDKEREKEEKRTKSRVIRADTHQQQHGHRQGHREYDGAQLNRLQDMKSDLLLDERVPLLILAFATNLWEVCTILWILDGILM